MHTFRELNFKSAFIFSLLILCGLQSNRKIEQELEGTGSSFSFRLPVMQPGLLFLVSILGEGNINSLLLVAKSLTVYSP